MSPAQGWHAQIEKCTQFFKLVRTWFQVYKKPVSSNIARPLRGALGDDQGSWSGSPACSIFFKSIVTSKSPVGDKSVVTLIRTDTTLDHSQEAEKVWTSWLCRRMYVDLFSSNTLLWTAACWFAPSLFFLGRSPHKNCKNDLDDQTWRELE